MTSGKKGGVLEVRRRRQPAVCALSQRMANHDHTDRLLRSAKKILIILSFSYHLLYEEMLSLSHCHGSVPAAVVAYQKSSVIYRDRKTLHRKYSVKPQFERQTNVCNSSHSTLVFQPATAIYTQYRPLTLVISCI